MFACTKLTLLNITTYLVAVDRSVATVGGVSIVLSSATVLHCVSLSTLQSDKDKYAFSLLLLLLRVDAHYLCVLKLRFTWS